MKKDPDLLDVSKVIRGQKLAASYHDLKRKQRQIEKDLGKVMGELAALGFDENSLLSLST